MSLVVVRVIHKPFREWTSCADRSFKFFIRFFIASDSKSGVRRSIRVRHFIYIQCSFDLDTRIILTSSLCFTSIFG